MILAEDIISVKGMLLITNGQEVNPSVCLRLKNFYEGGMINEPIKVLMPPMKIDRQPPNLADSTKPYNWVESLESYDSTGIPN
jgi:hypothetical protein